MELQVGETVLCTVDRIVGTVVFVKISFDGKEIEGNIVFSEVAPGRIRNIRDYVVPKKKIVCKVLRVSTNGNIDLSLRRVSQKENKEVREKAEEKQSYSKIIRSIFKEKADEIMKKIGDEEDVYELLHDAGENSEKIEKIMGKDDAEKIIGVLNAKKIKKAVMKMEIHVSSISPSGLEDIKNVFSDAKGAEIKYIAGGRYSIEIESSELKMASNELKRIVDEIERRAKKAGMEFSIKEK